MQSEQINELATALVNAQSSFEAVNKGRTATIPTKSGGSYSYSYADLGDIVKIVLPTLKENGLAFVQLPAAIDGLPALTTMLLHVSGQWISETMLLHIDKADAQGQGSAITYARRYALSALLGIVTETDDDGAKATETQRERRTQTGEISKEIETILQGAEADPSDNFLNSLAKQYLERGTLTGKQISSGVTAAQKVLDARTSFRAAPTAPERAPFDPTFSPEEERF